MTDEKAALAAALEHSLAELFGTDPAAWPALIHRERLLAAYAGAVAAVLTAAGEAPALAAALRALAAPPSPPSRGRDTGGGDERTR